MLCFGAFCNAGTPSTDSIVASNLFGIEIGNIDKPDIGASYRYNKWGDDPGRHKQGKCDAYDGGHSGVDIQTRDVASTRTADRIFYAVSRGMVIASGNDKYNTVAIYDQQKNITSLYLHARRADVRVGQVVEVGQRLGIQGDAGVTGAEHVHVEFRQGRHTKYACGASDPSSMDPIPIAEKYISDFNRLYTQCNNSHATLSGECGLLNTAISSSIAAPVCPYVYSSGYVYECLNLPASGKVIKDITLYSAPDIYAETSTIVSGTDFTAVERKSVIASCPLEVKVSEIYFPVMEYTEKGKPVKPYTLRYGKKEYPGMPPKKSAFVQGDTIFLVAQIGEGQSIYWYDGALVQANDSICTPTPYRALSCWAEPYRHCARDVYNNLMNSENWFNVKTATGQEGWIRLAGTNSDQVSWVGKC